MTSLFKFTVKLFCLGAFYLQICDCTKYSTVLRAFHFRSEMHGLHFTLKVKYTACISLWVPRNSVLTIQNRVPGSEGF